MTAGAGGSNQGGAVDGGGAIGGNGGAAPTAWVVATHVDDVSRPDEVSAVAVGDDDLVAWVDHALPQIFTAAEDGATLIEVPVLEAAAMCSISMATSAAPKELHGLHAQATHVYAFCEATSGRVSPCEFTWDGLQNGHDGAGNAVKNCDVQNDLGPGNISAAGDGHFALREPQGQLCSARAVADAPATFWGSPEPGLNDVGPLAVLPAPDFESGTLAWTTLDGAAWRLRWGTGFDDADLEERQLADRPSAVVSLGPYIYVAQTGGIARFDSATASAPDEVTFNPEVVSLASFASFVFAATPNGLYVVPAAFEPGATVELVAGTEGWQVLHLSATEHALYAGVTDGATSAILRVTPAN
ncbi:MAG: hypothetical protein JNK04_17110 [Myxococcales bacterium]|nr:hypothetical protein [Myxococcales bacterium]